MKLKAPSFWYKKSIISCLLYPLSILYKIGFQLDKSLRKPKRIDGIKTIGIGGYIIGGSGKTPFCLWLAEELKKQSINFAIITKGFGGSHKGPLLLKSEHSANLVGDEAILYRNRGFDVISSYNKLEGVKLAKDLGYEMVVIDDALQSHNLHKDIKVLVIDQKIGEGNGFCIPAGPLREPASNLSKSVDIKFVIGTNADGDIRVISPPHKQEYIAFSGIANPSKFYNSLKKLGIKISESIEYPDHYNYSIRELDSLLEKSKLRDLPLITTEKDWVKLDREYQNKIEYLKIELIVGENKKREILDKILS